MSPEPMPPAVTLAGVTKTFTVHGEPRTALEDVSLAVAPGETVAVVGESGAGKSTLVRLVSGLERPTSGEVRVGGKAPRLRGGHVSPVQMVFQNPTDALNPYRSVGRSIGEPLKQLRSAERVAAVAELLQLVGLDPGRADQRPRRFSGGQLQRVVVARALAAEPVVLLCDEPTSALDVSVQAQIVNLLLDLQEERGFACLLVTHDLCVARVLAHRVAVLREGRLIEDTPADEFFAEPRDAYSRELLALSGGALA